MRSTIFTEGRRVAASAACVILVAGPAAAQSASPGCYLRSYDGAHLRRNPQQTVAALSVRLGAGETVLPGIAEADVSAVMADTRTSREGGIVGQRFSRTLYCQVAEAPAQGDPGWFTEGATTCYAECDGGYFQIVSAAGATLLIRTAYVALGDEAEGCGGFGSLGDEGAPVTTYRLTRAPDAACE